MIKFSTIIYKVKIMVEMNNSINVDFFLKKALNNEFSPSEQTLKNIMAFSDAYSYSRSESIGDLDQVLN